MHFVCSSFLGRPTSLRSSIIVSLSSLSLSRPCSPLLNSLSLFLVSISLFLCPSPSFRGLFDPPAYPSHAYTYFFLTAWHKSSSRSTPEFRHSRLGFQRAYECTEMLLIEIAFECRENEIVPSSSSCCRSIIAHFKIRSRQQSMAFILSRKNTSTTERSLTRLSFLLM